MHILSIINTEVTTHTQKKSYKLEKETLEN